MRFDDGDDGEERRALPLWADAQTLLPCIWGPECTESTPAENWLEREDVPREEENEGKNRGSMGRRRRNAAAAVESISTLAEEQQQGGVEKEADLVIIIALRRPTIATARAESIRWVREERGVFFLPSELRLASSSGEF